MILGPLMALHLLGVVVWVGGMAFALAVVRPSLAVLAPTQRLAVHAQIFPRFFRLIWHAMPIVLASGYAMLFGVFGGFAGVGWPVHVMHLLGLVMAAVFLIIFFGPWAAFRAGEGPARAAAVERIRRLVLLNLVLGLITVAVAAFAA